MHKNLLPLLLLCLSFYKLPAQNLEDLLLNLWEPKEWVLSEFSSFGFEQIEAIEYEFCTNIEMRRAGEILFLNFCSAGKDSLSDLTLNTKNLETAQLYRQELKELEGWDFSRNYLMGYTANIYTDPSDFEISAVNFSVSNLYSLTVSGYPTFADNKERVETEAAYDASKDINFLIRKLATTKNSAGESIEAMLNYPHKFLIENYGDDEFNMNDLKSGPEYDKMIKIVEEDFLRDDHFYSQASMLLTNIQNLFVELAPDPKLQDEQMYHMMVENELYGSMVIFSYLFERLER